MPISDNINGPIISEAQFYAEARTWAAIVRNIAKANAAAFKDGKTVPKTYKSGKKAGKTEKKLKDSISFLIKRNPLDAVESVSFKVPIHGIWREWAVGYGQPRVAGKYIARNSKIKRHMSDWLDEPIGKNINKLFDLSAQYYGDQVLVRGFGSKEKHI